jgi:predicted RNA binding protein YcfA (HicA-like mRNA interferase family)
MPKLTPLAWKKFVGKLHRLGFDGPYQEGKHPYMVKKNLVITIPNRHEKDLSADLLSRFLRQAGVSREEWNDA